MTLRDELRDLPDDPATWLVYADELTQRGDPRGEILVLEAAGHHERAATLADDWVTTHGEQLADANVSAYLRARELAALAPPPDLQPVFRRLGQLIALVDVAQCRQYEVAPVFELHRKHVVAATLAWIDRAFDGVPVPDEDHLTLAQAEEEDNLYGGSRSPAVRARDHLGRWQELPDEHLQANPYAVWHLDEQGIHYYAPAIMSFDLRGQYGLVVDHFLVVIQPGSYGDPARHAQRLSLLDRAQRAAIHAYAVVETYDDWAKAAWGRVVDAEREAARDDWFAIFNAVPRP